MPTDRQRQRLAQEAARIIAEEGITDFHWAKQKAASRLGVGNRTSLPRNGEIEAALEEHLRLFHSQTQPAQIRAMRETALLAMKQLQPFQPRLVGALLRGTADSHSPIELHLFAETAEEVVIHLMDRHVSYEMKERQWRSRAGNAVTPVIRVSFGEYDIKLYVFPLLGLRSAPLCPVEKRPMQRMDTEQLTHLLHQP